jgi:hypothetical protein
LIGTIFVNAAGGRSIIVFLQEGAFEKNLTAGPATIAIASAKRERLDDLIFAEIRSDETPELALRLAGAEFGILDCPRATCCDKTFI